MIVICMSCQAKFRVADEKIGPRGAKVRCSRCRTVFLVHPDLGSMPVDAPPAGPTSAQHVDLEPSRAATAHNPFAAQPVRASAPPPIPPPLPPQASSDPAPDDPFGAAGLGGPAEPDPFGSAGLDLPSPGDPFAAEAGFEPHGSFAPESSDPFEPAPVDRSLPVTDLSDLGVGAPPGHLAEPPREPDEPSARPPLAAQSPEEDGLSLEDRTTPMPRPVAPGSPPSLAADPFDGPAAGDPFAMGAAFEAGDYELGGGEDLALATESTERPAEPPEPRRPAAPPPIPSTPRGTAQPPTVRSPDGNPAAAAPAPAATESRVPGTGGSRLRAIAVNAVGLAALLLAALAILAILRNDGRLDAASLRPAALLGFARSDGAVGPFTTRVVTSGLYERDRAPPVLFVRGAVVSRAPEPARGVRVSVEVVRDGRVLARGEALAGALPTPEELWAARDAERLEKLARDVASRAPANTTQGDEVPFLVVMEDPPEDLHGASLRLRAFAVEDFAGDGAAVEGAAGGAQP